MLRAIFGADRRDGGEMYRDEQRVLFEHPRAAVRDGVCLLTENRREEGLVLPMAVRVDVTLRDLARISRAGLPNGGADKALEQSCVAELDIRIVSLEEAALGLSGVIQQQL